MENDDYNAKCILRAFQLTKEDLALTADDVLIITTNACSCPTCKAARRLGVMNYSHATLK